LLIGCFELRLAICSFFLLAQKKRTKEKGGGPESLVPAGPPDQPHGGREADFEVSHFQFF
jgi:hypothetical protein